MLNVNSHSLHFACNLNTYLIPYKDINFAFGLFCSLVVAPAVFSLFNTSSLRCPLPIAHWLITRNKLFPECVRGPRASRSDVMTVKGSDFHFYPHHGGCAPRVPAEGNLSCAPPPWPCHWMNRQAHVCMNYYHQPSHLRSTPPSCVEIS